MILCLDRNVYTLKCCDAVLIEIFTFFVKCCESHLGLDLEVC